MTDNLPLSPKGLPLLPSALLELAVNDLEEIERTEGYVIDMHRWHEPLPGWVTGNDARVCAVCLAGCVIANTFKANILGDYTASHYTPVEGALLRALDEARCYGWREFLSGVETAARKRGVNFPAPCEPRFDPMFEELRELEDWSYEGSKDLFKASMRDAVEILRRYEQ